MTNQTMPTYAVDIVFCIDLTGSMKPYISSVKETALHFYDLLEAEMASKGKGIRQCRLRFSCFRDIREDGDRAIIETGFFELPRQLDEFKSFVSGLEAERGDDEPESALEALALAIRSEWERHMDKRRHVIVVCTDVSAHPLGESPLPQGLANRNLPNNLEELQAMWGDQADDGEMEFSAKRLIVFAPDCWPWNYLVELFENCIWVPSQPERGMIEAAQPEVLNRIAGSV